VIQAAIYTIRVTAARAIRVSVVGATLATAAGVIRVNADGPIRVSVVGAILATAAGVIRVIAGATAAEQGSGAGV
jgi:hypothetical protein